jgi:hypothetical protein
MSGQISGRAVIELGLGITVYPARCEGDRWRAVWYEDGQRQQCESVREDKLAAVLQKVAERLEADAPNMRRPGAELIAHYLDPDRLPVEKRWSRKHAHTQANLEIQRPAGWGTVYSDRWARWCVMVSMCPAASLSNW